MPSEYHGGLQSPLVMGVITAAGVIVVSFVAFSLIVGAAGKAIGKPPRGLTIAEVRFIADSGREADASQVDECLAILRQRLERAGLMLGEVEALDDDLRRLTIIGHATEWLLLRGETGVYRLRGSEEHFALTHAEPEACRPLVEALRVVNGPPTHFRTDADRADQIAAQAKETGCLPAEASLLVEAAPLREGRTADAYLVDASPLVATPLIAGATVPESTADRTLRIGLTERGQAALASLGPQTKDSAVVAIERQIIAVVSGDRLVNAREIAAEVALPATDVVHLGAVIGAPVLPLRTVVTDILYRK